MVNDYYESEYQDWAEASLMEFLDEVEDLPQRCGNLKVLRDPLFYGQKGILAALLTIKHDKVITYDAKRPFSVIESASRKGQRPARHFPHAILFIWAYKVWRPKLNSTQLVWIRTQAKKIQNAAEAGEATYNRNTAYDAAITFLFPDLGERLATGYCAVPPSEVELQWIQKRVDAKRAEFD